MLICPAGQKRLHLHIAETVLGLHLRRLDGAAVLAAENVDGHQDEEDGQADKGAGAETFEL